MANELNFFVRGIRRGKAYDDPIRAEVALNLGDRSYPPPLPVGDVSGSRGKRPRWIDKGYVPNGGDAHRRAMEAAVDKRDTMIDVGVYNGLDQLSILGYTAEFVVLAYDYVWRAAKARGFVDASSPHLSLRPPDDLSCWPDEACQSMKWFPDGIDSYTPRDLANLCNCWRLCCAPTLSVEATQINLFGRDRDDPGMLERIRQDLDKRHHFGSKVERLNLPYGPLREIGFDLTNEMTKSWFFDDDGTVSDDEVTVIRGACGLGQERIIPTLKDREELPHAREMVDLWLLISQLKKFRAEITNIYNRYVKWSSLLDKPEAKTALDARRDHFDGKTILKDALVKRYRMLIHSLLEDMITFYGGNFMWARLWHFVGVDIAVPWEDPCRDERTMGDTIPTVGGLERASRRVECYYKNKVVGVVDDSVGATFYCTEGHLDDFSAAMPKTMQFTPENFKIDRAFGLSIRMRQVDEEGAKYRGAFFDVTVYLDYRNVDGESYVLRAMTSSQQKRIEALTAKLETRLGSVWNVRRFIEVVSLHVKYYERAPLIEVRKAHRAGACLLCAKHWEEVDAGGEQAQRAQSCVRVAERTEAELGVVLWHTCLEDLHRECMVGAIDSKPWMNKVKRKRRNDFHEWQVKTIQKRRGVDLRDRHEFARSDIPVEKRGGESAEVADVLPRQEARWYDPDRTYAYAFERLEWKDNGLKVSEAVERVDAGEQEPSRAVAAVAAVRDIDPHIAIDGQAQRKDRVPADAGQAPYATGRFTSKLPRRPMLTSPGVNLPFVVDKIKDAYERSYSETPAEVLELNTECRRVAWEQRLRFPEQFETNMSRIRYEEDGIVPHRERYVDALKKFGVMYGTTRAFAVEKALLDWDNKLVDLIESTLCQVTDLYLVLGVLRENVETTDGWKPESWSVGEDVTGMESLYVAGIYVILIQVFLRMCLLVFLYNPIQNEWCRTFCECIVNYQVGAKDRDKFMIEDDFRADFTNPWSQVCRLILIGWPLYIMQPDWGTLFMNRYCRTDDDTLFAYRDRLRKFRARAEPNARREQLPFSKEAFQAKMTDLRLRNDAVSLVVLRIAKDPFFVLLLFITWFNGVVSFFTTDGCLLILLTLATSLLSFYKAFKGSFDLCRSRRHIYDADSWWSEIRTLATYFKIELHGTISVDDAVHV
mmetsp:Transcript_29921/g.89499  ORF Transcript_29921/g.89499 Transcript_29921/m.89499 type:complete len:1160 (-) Transcript_29921:51-3530(-)